MEIGINLMKRIICESVKAVLLYENDSQKQKEIDDAWSERDADNARRKEREIERMYQMGKKRPDFNTKKVERWFKTGSGWNPRSYYRYEDEEGPEDKIAKEFLNRPNAATDFVHFPRQSVHRDLDFDTLSGGSEKIRREKSNLRYNSTDHYRSAIRKEMYKEKQRLFEFFDYLKGHNYDHGVFTDDIISFLKGIVKKNVSFYDNDLLELQNNMEYEVDNWFDAIMYFMRNEYLRNSSERNEFDEKISELREKLVDENKL